MELHHDASIEEVRDVVALWLPPGRCEVFRDGPAFVVVWSSVGRDLPLTREGRSDRSFDEAVHRLIAAAAAVVLLWRQHRDGSPVAAGGAAKSQRNDAR